VPLSPALLAALIRRKMRHACGFVANEIGDPSGVIGWYTNPAPWSHVKLVFTMDELCVCGDQLDGTDERRVKLADIVDFQLPDAPNATGVRLITKDGLVFVRMAGRLALDSGQRDVFCLVRVLHAYFRALGQPVRGQSSLKPLSAAKGRR
jgi:hypothetical protein